MIKCCILAGGFGTRLAEETDRIPKPMVEVGHRPMLWHVMETLSAGGCSQFFVAAGYRQDRIKDWVRSLPSATGDLYVDLVRGTERTEGSQAPAWTVMVADTGLDTQTGGRLLRMREYLSDAPFLLTYGDGLANINLELLLQQHRNSPYMVTITAVRPPARFGALTLEGSSVTRFDEKSATSDSLINGGYMIMNPEIFDLVQGDHTVLESDVLPVLAAEGRLGAYVHEGFWMPMDTLREKRELEALWQTGEPPWLSIG